MMLHHFSHTLVAYFLMSSASPENGKSVRRSKSNRRAMSIDDKKTSYAQCAGLLCG